MEHFLELIYVCNNQEQFKHNKGIADGSFIKRKITMLYYGIHVVVSTFYEALWVCTYLFSVSTF